LVWSLTLQEQDKLALFSSSRAAFATTVLHPHLDSSPAFELLVQPVIHPLTCSTLLCLLMLTGVSSIHNHHLQNKPTHPDHHPWLLCHIKPK
jgi:hypothetical protein